MRFGQRLSPREKEMIGALCLGERASEIARRLCLSPKTVEGHISNARIKLGARTHAAAVYEYLTRYKVGP